MASKASQRLALKAPKLFRDVVCVPRRQHRTIGQLIGQSMVSVRMAAAICS
jgi:hypothetical protein